MTRDESIELEIRRSLSQLRHLYWNIMQRRLGDPESLANFLLAPEIRNLEALADSLQRGTFKTDA